MNIPSLRSGDFAGLTNLQELIVTASPNLTTLPADIFNGLDSLTDLSLLSNGLTMLPANVFSDLTDTLTALNLFGNQLTELPSDIFNGLEMLTTLNVSGNRLTELPAGIFSDLTAVRLLNVSGNQLMELPAGIFSGLTALIGVDVSGQEDASGNAIGLLLLTVTPKMVSDGIAVIGNRGGRSIRQRHGHSGDNRRNLSQ